MKYIEQDGHIFKESSSGQFEYVPQKIMQDGNIFKFNFKTKNYDYLESVKQEAPPSAPEDFPHALRVGFEKAMTFGTRPTIAGAGGALGAFVGSLQSGLPIGKSFQAGKEAFSQARDEAILEQIEASKKSPMGSFIGELGGNIATAPLLPVKTLAGALKVGAITGTGEAIGEAKTSKEALETLGANIAFGGGAYGVGKGISKGFDKTKDYIKTFIPEKMLAKIASTTTGIPEQDIITYSKNIDEVNKMIKKYDGNIDIATDEAKERLNNSIKKTKQELNNSIENSLDTASKDKFIPLDTILNKIENVKSKIDPDLNPELINEINDFINRISKKSGESIVVGHSTNAVSIQELNLIKNYLADNAKDAYVKNGAIFARDTKVARAANEGYLEAKKIIDSLAPNIKSANQKFHQLHVLENQINKNILAVGKPSAAFLSAGAKENIRGRNQLKLLGELTGTPILEEAEKISAMRSFADTKILPQGERTGYALGRIATGAGIGAVIAESQGGDYKTGAAIGAAMTGPTALKALINTGNITSKTINKAVQSLDNPYIRSVIQREIPKPEKTEHEIESIKRRLNLYR